MVKNPNSVLQEALQTALQGTNMRSRTFLHISTTNSIIKGGGGTANTAFLASSHILSAATLRPRMSRPPSGSRRCAGTGGNPDIHQLQYTQFVMLDFNGIHWPHVTVGTLRKQ